MIVNPIPTVAELAARVYPDTAKPACDRSRLRELWIQAVEKMRERPGGGPSKFVLDRPVPRRGTPYRGGDQ